MKALLHGLVVGLLACSISAVAHEAGEQASVQPGGGISGPADYPGVSIAGPIPGPLVAIPHTPWPADTDVSGSLPCSAGKPDFQRACDYRMKRNGPDASIWVIRPGSCSDLRVLYFENRRFSTDDDSELSFARQGDDWRVSAGEQEFYLIPDAVISGG